MKTLLRAWLFIGLLFGIMVLIVHIVSKYKREEHSKIKVESNFDSTGVIHYYNNDTLIAVQDQQITLPSNSVQLDYPTDTIYIHDTIYKTKKVIKYKNNDSVFQEPLIREIIEQRDTARPLDKINLKDYEP